MSVLIRSKYSVWVLALVLIAVTGWLYADALSYDFVHWDDDAYVYQNPLIKSWSAENVKNWFFRPQVKLFVPVTMASYALDYSRGRLNPAVYHQTNLAIHLVNVVMVFLLLKFFLSDLFLAFSGALMFSIHPVQIETVAWISQRKTLLSSLFVFLTLWQCRRIVPSGKISGRKLASLIGLWALAVLSKVTVVFLPVVLALSFNRLSGSEKSKRLTIFFASTSTVGLMLGFATLIQYRGIENHYRMFSSAEVFFQSITGLLIYIRNLFWPFELSLFYQKSVEFQGHEWAEMGWLAAAISLVGLWIYQLFSRNRNVFWLNWFFIFLFPLAVLFPVPVEDHHLYLPLFGLIGLACHLLKGKKIWIKSILLFLTVAVIPYHQTQLAAWANTVSLLGQAVEKKPANFRAKLLLASALFESGRKFEAQQMLNEVILNFPERKEGYVNAVSVAIGRGNIGWAEAIRDRMAKSFSNDSDYFLVQAMIATAKGDHAAVLRYAEESFKRGSGSEAVLVPLAEHALKSGDRAAAKQYLSKLSESYQPHPSALFLKALLAIGDQNWRKGLELLELISDNGDRIEGYYFQLGYVRLKMGEKLLAEKAYQQSIRLQPQIAEAYFHLGLLRFEEGRFAEALLYFRGSVDLKPESEQFKEMLHQVEMRVGSGK